MKLKMVYLNYLKKFIDKIKNEWSNSMMEEPNKVQKKPTVWSKFKKLLGWN